MYPNDFCIDKLNDIRFLFGIFIQIIKFLRIVDIIYSILEEIINKLKFLIYANEITSPVIPILILNTQSSNNELDPKFKQFK